VWGVPAEGAKAAAWRLETMERQFGSDRAVAVDGMELSVLQGGRSVAGWSGASGEDGVAEATLRADEPLSGTVEVRVARGNTLLALGPIALHAAPPVTLATSAIEGTAAGPIALRVEVSRGVLAAPFAGVIVVRATRDGAPAEGISLDVTAGGADLAPGSKGVRTSPSGEASIRIIPVWHAIELKIEATDPRAESAAPKSTWEGGLPVHPGALWLGLARPSAQVMSPVPRDRVYVSALGPAGRVFGQVVPLAKNESGLYEGALDVTELSSLGAEAITIAGDPQELGTGTVTWPLDSAASVTASPRLELLFDGIPFAERREKSRAGTARLISVGVAFVAALLEAVMLVLYSRESQAKLAAHLAQASEDESDRAAAARMTAAPASRAVTLVMLVGLVLLGFSAVAAFAIVR
jgi:hypothetical protein